MHSKIQKTAANRHSFLA